jgi:TolA-binding protein
VSPKAVQYRANSIIYFEGDVPDNRVFILNSGKVCLKYVDIETGQEIQELIQTGAFFGVKSALGRYPQEETAQVISDSNVVVFSVPEFEQLAAQNTRVILKMLQVFSNQLRRIHKQVQNLLFAKATISPEKGLYSVASYYLKQQRYSQAIYALSRYLMIYPHGQFVQEVNRDLALAETKFGQQKNLPKNPSTLKPQVFDARIINKPDKTKELSGTAQQYYQGMSFVTNQKYKEALEVFKSIIESGLDEEYVPKAAFEVGRCYFFLRQHDKSNQIFSNLIQKYPKHPDLNEALYFVAKANEETGSKKKAFELYRKLLSLTAPTDSLNRKVRQAYKALEGEV